MRKLFCGSCAVGVAVAVCVYCIAQWMEGHSSSFPARCAHVALRVATDWNPVVQAGRIVGQQSAGMFRAAPSKPAACGQPAVPCLPADPGEGRATPPVIEVIDLSSFPSVKMQEQVVVGEEKVEMVPPGAIEETEPMPPPMPPCDDEKMEPAGWCDFWLHLFNDDEIGWKNVEVLPMPHEMDGTVPEELPMPEAVNEAATEETDMPADKQEEADHHDGEMHCPYPHGCPGVKQCPSGGK